MGSVSIHYPYTIDTTVTATATVSDTVSDTVSVMAKDCDEKKEITDEKDEVMIFYLSNINAMITPYEAEDLAYYQKQLPKELLIFGMQKAVEQKARKIAYIKSIWDAWISKGITTLEEAKVERKQTKNDDTWEIVRRNLELEGKL